MNKNIKNRIAEYEFKDSKQMTWGLQLGNLLLELTKGGYVGNRFGWIVA